MTHVSLLDLTWYQVVAFGLAYFSAIYLLLGALTLWLTRRVLPALATARCWTGAPCRRGNWRANGGCRRCRLSS